MALHCPHCGSEGVAWSDNYCGMCAYPLKPGLIMTSAALDPAVAAALKAAWGALPKRGRDYDIEVLP